MRGMAAAVQWLGTVGALGGAGLGVSMAHKTKREVEKKEKQWKRYYNKQKIKEREKRRAMTKAMLNEFKGKITKGDEMNGRNVREDILGMLGAVGLLGAGSLGAAMIGSKGRRREMARHRRRRIKRQEAARKRAMATVKRNYKTGVFNKQQYQQGMRTVRGFKFSRHDR